MRMQLLTVRKVVRRREFCILVQSTLYMISVISLVGSKYRFCRRTREDIQHQLLDESSSNLYEYKTYAHSEFRLLLSVLFSCGFKLHLKRLIERLAVARWRRTSSSASIVRHMPHTHVFHLFAAAAMRATTSFQTYETNRTPLR